MKTNWLLDSNLDEKEVRTILRNERHPKFYIYAEKLFSRMNDPKVVFDIIEKKTFCKTWMGIKKRMKRDRWIKNKVIFWQAIYERVEEQLKVRGVKLRYPKHEKIPAERKNIAEQIKKLRKKMGATQREFAAKLGVIQQYISRIETGRENLSIDALSRIADVFGKELVIKLR